MAIQGIVTAKIKHKRASAPKSRNGCITWYACPSSFTFQVQWLILSVCLQQAKPVCNRCCEDKIKCDGYAMPKPKAPRRKHPSQDLHIIMICCLLFVSFEGLTGRYDELLQHLSAGISLFDSALPSSNDEERAMTTKLAEMFCRLGVESSNFMQKDPSVSGMRKWYHTNERQHSQSPKPFSNLDEASSALRRLDVLYDEKPWHYEGSDAEGKETLVSEASANLQSALDGWSARLDALYEARSEDIMIEGEQQYRNLRLRQQYWQMAINSYSTKEAAANPKTFEPFLAAAREAAAPFIALRQPTFSLDGDLISGLAFVASTTTDDETKVQALDLLWRLNRREGLLDSRDFVELHELARALETCEEPNFDENWKPTAAAGLPTIIERLRNSLGQLHI
uniref:Zn(2)-C6 fungal-type domain-containing protein n=1 Tax=Fusarium oxysporum (strain Fo5176) TaxID=660025 RepID=A0A0C4DI97_FUSOF